MQEHNDSVEAAAAAAAAVVPHATADVTSWEVAESLANSEQVSEFFQEGPVAEGDTVSV